MARHESILVFEDRPAYNRWLGHLNSVETAFTVHRLGGSDIIVTATAATHGPVADALPAPRAIVGAATGFRLARRELFPEGITVPIGTATVGDGNVAVFAGPCAVESREQLLSTAMWVESHGAVGLRGGAFKPRTSPYSFQGLRWDALDLLAEARSRTGLPVLTEVIEPGHVERLAELTDAFQVGARNMQNFSLLTELGRAGKPVVLKRGFGTTMAELLAASEYILAENNDRVVLCERGIRTFEPSARFTLDLSTVALLKRRTHLPVMVDPSHAAGIPELVEPLALAAAAVGADALLVDVHVRPELALCDGNQALTPAAFGRLMSRLEMVVMSVGKKLAGGTGQGLVEAEPSEVFAGDVA